MNTNFKTITGKILEYMENHNMPEPYKLETEKIVYAILDKEKNNTKKTISFTFEIIKFIVYILNGQKRVKIVDIKIRKNEP